MNTPHDEQIAVAAIRLAKLQTGDKLELSGGYVKRVRPREFVLHADNNKTRARWGTLEEIIDDVRIFVVTGALPKANGGPW